MMNDPIEVSSLSAFVEHITILNRLRKVNVERNEILFFRGQNNHSFKLLPALARDSCQYSNVTLLDYERNLIESAKRRYPSVFSSCQTPLDLLALLQHYGILTRLLDVTKNPLVALYFACKGEIEQDAEVFAFKDDQRDMAQYPIVNAIADSYRFLQATIYPLNLFYLQIIHQPYFSEQFLSHELYHFSDKNGRYTKGEKWIQACCARPIFVYAQELSQRQKAQQGSFILFSNHIESSLEAPYFHKNIRPIAKDDSCIVGRFIIPAKCKKDISNQLAMVEISEASLFPDSIDKGCAEIAANQRAQLITENDN